MALSFDTYRDRPWFGSPRDAEDYVRRMEEDFRRREEHLIRELHLAASLQVRAPMWIGDVDSKKLAAIPKAPATTRSKLLLLL